MLDELTFDDLIYWAAFEQLEPWGPNAAFNRSAAVARATLLPHLKQGATLPEADDIFPHLKVSEQANDESDPGSEKERLKVMVWVAASGGTIERAS